MIRQKSYTVSLRFADPINYAVEKEKNVLKSLRDTYQGVCYQGSFIVTIASVDRMSDIAIEKSNLRAEGMVNVTFTAFVALIEPGNIVMIDVSNLAPIAGSRVADAVHSRDVIDPLVVPVTAMVLDNKKNNVNSVIFNGASVAVRTLQTYYQPFGPAVSVVGYVLTADSVTTVYQLRKDLSKEEALGLLEIVNAIKRELDLRAKMDPKKVMFFEELLGGGKEAGVVDFASGHTWFGPKGAGGAPSGKTTYVNVVETVERISEGENVKTVGVWSKGPDVSRSSPMWERGEGSTAATGPAKPSRVTLPERAFKMMLKETLDYLQGVRAYVEKFTDTDMIEEHEAIWEAMRAAK